MNPRSSEFMEAARRRLAAAKVAVEQDPSTALSAAYYAMLYGARAALSERDTSAKTHRGVWHEFQLRSRRHGEQSRWQSAFWRPSKRFSTEQRGSVS